MVFYDVQSRAFEDFFSALDILSNACLTLQTIDPVTMEIFQREVTYMT